MDSQQPFGRPDPSRPFAPPDPYAPPPPLAAPSGPSFVPVVVIGLVIALVTAFGLVTVGWRVATDGVDRPFSAGTFEGGTCGPVVDDRLPADATHSQTTVVYDPAPPSSGPHNPMPLPRGQRVVPWDGAPELVAERAVHNLEHAYVVVWYDDPFHERAIASIVAAVPAQKVIAVPWARGSFEGDATFVLTAWGHRRACTGLVSPREIEAFYETYGGVNGDAPEKAAP